VTLKYHSEPQQGGISLWRILAILGGLGVAAALLTLAQRPAPATVTLLVPPYRFPVPIRERLGRWIPRSPRWAGVWRVEEIVFGRRKTVVISMQVMSFAEAPSTVLSDLALGPPAFSATNGLQVWLPDGPAMKALRQRLDQTRGLALLARPTILAADGSECFVSTGQTVPINGSTSVGLSLRCLALLHPRLTDLTASILHSELANNTAAVAASNAFPLVSIQTNLDTGLRLRIPKGRGILLLDRGSADSRHKHIGVLIDPLQPAP
jgi:hypothetical protein